MMHSFPELTIGGVLIAPFVIYAGAAIAIFAVLRPFLHFVGFDLRLHQPADRRTEPLRRDPRVLLIVLFQKELSPCNYQAPSHASKKTADLTKRQPVDLKPATESSRGSVQSVWRGARSGPRPRPWRPYSSSLSPCSQR